MSDEFVNSLLVSFNPSSGRQRSDCNIDDCKCFLLLPFACLMEERWMIEQLGHASDRSRGLFERRLALEVTSLASLSDNPPNDLVDAFSEATDRFPVFFERHRNHFMDLFLLTKQSPCDCL